MPLTKAKVDALKPKGTRYMEKDANGLYIEIMPSGNKYWRLRCQVDNKTHLLSLGQYPEVSLLEARKTAAEKRIELKKGGDSLTFAAWFEKWFSVYSNTVSALTAKATHSKAVNYILPSLGAIPISEISPQHIAALRHKTQTLGHPTVVNVSLRITNTVLKYAISEGVTLKNQGIFFAAKNVKYVTKHHASLQDIASIKTLIQRISNTELPVIHRSAFLFLAYTFCRTQEVLRAEWGEIDWSAKQWKVPAERMKARRPHIVPLPHQCLDILDNLKKYTGDTKYIFTLNRNYPNPMHMEPLRMRLRKWYTGEEFTLHGFRSIASTILNESGYFRTDAIELQLSHVEANNVRASYNYAKLIPERTVMMQWYADYLDALRNGKPKPVPDLTNIPRMI